MSVWKTEGIPFHRWLVFRSVWFGIWLTLKPLLQIRVTGAERIPKQGGALLLANHTTFWDFLLCFWGVYRPIHAIGSEQVFRLPVAGFMLRQVLAIPYAKGAKDGAAVRGLAKAFQAGGLIGMFPEGERSWTGDPLPVTRGTGRLVKSLGCPVIYCRVTTGFLQHPRWATYPRWVPWRMDYSAPEHFAKDATVEQINAALERGLAIDPATVALPKGSWGFRLAEGLPEYLWACPSCFEVEGLSVATDRDCVRCSGCERRWRVDLRARLVPERPEHQDTPELTVGQAHARLIAHFDIQSPLGCPRMDVTGIQRGRLSQEPVATGEARVTDTGVEIWSGGERKWRLPFSEMSAVLLQFRNALQIRTKEANFQLDPVGQSRLRWHYFVHGRWRAWRAANLD